MSVKNAIKDKDNMLKQGSNGFVSAMVEWLEPKQKTILLKKENYINIQNQINGYLKQPWVSADRKKIANELRNGIAEFKGNAIPFEDISSLLINAQNKILEQDKKRLVIKKPYSRLHQVIANIIEGINCYYRVESELAELANPMKEKTREELVERVKRVRGVNVFFNLHAKKEPRLLPEAVTKRDLKSSSPFIRGCFKPFYRGFNANLAKNTAEMEATEQQTMPALNSRG